MMESSHFYKSLFSEEHNATITAWLITRVLKEDDIRNKVSDYSGSIKVYIDHEYEEIVLQIGTSKSVILTLLRIDKTVTVLKNYIMVSIYDELVLFVNSLTRKEKINSLLL
jgi:hypothetical protein